MNRSFLIIFIPAVLVAAAYLYMGIRPPVRAEIGVALFAAVIAAIRLKAMLRGRKAVRPAGAPAEGQAPPAGPLPGGATPSEPVAPRQS